MSKVYRVKAFAALAGVTIKTLHHYDRLGLLKPQRTAAGYRVYSDADLPRLAEIAALKLIGVPLKRVAALLRPDVRSVSELLESQRRVLSRRREALQHAIDAIDHARSARSLGASDVDVLRRLIEALEMQNGIDVLKEYFEPDAWERWRAVHDEWPGEEWRALLRDVEQRLDLDPASREAGALAERWNELAKTDAGGDREIRIAFLKAWRDWIVRPERRPKGFAAFDMDRILPFIVNAADAEHERRRLASPETARVPPRVGASRLALYHDVSRVLDSDPAGEIGREMARRYDRLLDSETGGDEPTKNEMREAWRYRRSWPSGVVRWVAATYDMEPAAWIAANEYLQRAVEAARA